MVASIMATPAPVSGSTPASRTAVATMANTTLATTMPTPILRMPGAAASA